MPVNSGSIFNSLIERTGVAVAHYWNTRIGQHDRQRQAGKADQGARSAVTGGAQMDGFIDLFAELIVQAGIPERFIFRKKAVELAGFFRPTKEWDLRSRSVDCLSRTRLSRQSSAISGVLFHAGGLPLIQPSRQGQGAALLGVS